jgi:hypothetical protein
VGRPAVWISEPSSEGTFRNSAWENHSYEVRIGPRITAFAPDGKNRFQADAGVVVRNYEVAPSLLTFTIDSPGRVTITTEEFEFGELNLRIDARTEGLVNVKNGGATFQLPPGQHAVEVTRNTK